MTKIVSRIAFCWATAASAAILIAVGSSCGYLSFGGTHDLKLGPVHTDVAGLQKRCELPTGVKSCQWQIHSRMDDVGFGDWGLYAAVELEDPDAFDWGDEELGEAKVRDLPEWMLNFAGETLVVTESKRGSTIPGVMYGPAAVAKSPLLNGKIIKTPQKRLLLILWTT